MIELNPEQEWCKEQEDLHAKIARLESELERVRKERDEALIARATDSKEYFELQVECTRLREALRKIAREESGCDRCDDKIEIARDALDLHASKT